MIWLLSIAALVMLVALAAVSYPLIFHPLEAYLLPEQPDDRFSERDALLEAMSDLEQANQAGKLSLADYEEQKARLEVRYIQVADGPPPEEQ